MFTDLANAIYVVLNLIKNAYIKYIDIRYKWIIFV